MSGGRGEIPQTSSKIDVGVEGLTNPALIGQGGFGAVYRAEQSALGRTVAIKILSAPGLDDDTRARFERECIAVGALSGHPHIVTVYDSGINSWGRPFIVMDFMSRGSVADRVATEGPIPWPEAVDMGVKICGAVATAHSAGILHRDVKPQNVLVSAYGEPKLGDFGISSIGGNQTSSGTVTASLEHAAPELLDGSPATIGTDVYAVTSTIFTMLAGEPPFARRSDEPIQSLIARVLTDPPPDLRPRGVPGALCAVIERGLAKDPLVRFASTSELGAALREVQEQQGIVPTAVIQTEPIGGFEALDRFAPATTGTTAPTRARVRNGYVPPIAAPPSRPAFWKRPLFAAAMVALVLIAGATAVAMTRADDDAEPPSTPVADGTDVADNGDDDDSARKENVRKQRVRDGKKKGGRASESSFASGGGGAGIPPPLPPSSDSSSASSGGGTSAGGGAGNGGNDGGGGSSGSKEPKEEPPPSKPPPPDVWLYHLWKGTTHVATIDPNGYPSDYGRSAEGLVYRTQRPGTTPIIVEEGTVYIFKEEYGDTEPDVSRAPLYKMTKGSEWFYTSSESKRANYVNNWAWNADGPLGYVGEL